MSWKGFFKGALKVGQFAAPFIPGVGPIAEMGIQAGLGALNAKANGGGVKSMLLGGGLGAAGGAIGGVGNKLTSGIQNTTMRSLANMGIQTAGNMGLNALGNKLSGGANGGNVSANGGNAPAGTDLTQQGLAGQQVNLSKLISDISQRQHSIADPAISKAMAYYSKLAGGNSAAIQSTLAPQIASMTDVYRGAESGMTNKMGPGAGRDMAVADLQRQKAAQLSMMPMMARTNANEQLGTMGQTMTGQANSMLGMAAGPLSSASNAMNIAQQQKDATRSQWLDFGASMGKIFLPYVLGKAGGAGGSTPSTPGQTPSYFPPNTSFPRAPVAQPAKGTVIPPLYRPGFQNSIPGLQT